MFRAKCPCCGADLEIDERRNRITHYDPVKDEEQSVEDRFASKLDKVRKDKAEQDQKFDAAAQREKERKQRLASLFDDASKKAKEKKDEPPPLKFWD